MIAILGISWFFHLEKIERRGGTAEMQDQIRRSGKRKGEEGPRGFTLAELVITMALIGIVAVIAVPTFQNIAVNGNLKTAAADLASDFALYRQRALAENRMYQITLNDAQNYSIQRWANPGSAFGGWEPFQNKNLATIAGDIAFTTEPGVYTFQPRGLITGDTNAIGLTNRRGSMATMNISAAGRTSARFNFQ